MNFIKEKVVVIGLDGATFDIIDPLIQKGRLPHLASLIREGCRAPFRSTIMPNSFPAWVSAATGVNPGKHSIYWSLIRRENNSYPLQLMTALDIKVKTVWDILGEQNYEVGVVNIPTEYPPRQMNGFLVCGALTPDTKSAFTYPRELEEEIFDILPDYRCEIDFAHIRLEDLRDQILHSIQNRERLILHLMEKRRWDLFFAVFTETDLAQHKFWACIDEKHPEHESYNHRYGPFVFSVYERLDQAIGKIVRSLPDEAKMFVVSDHGFGPFYQSFSVSRWLEKEGYLVLKRTWDQKVKKSMAKRRSLVTRIKKYGNLLSPLWAKSQQKKDVRAMREKDERISTKLSQRIDWNRSRAYYTSDYGIRLNLRGREPHGTVEPGTEEEKLKKTLKDALSRLTFSNGQPVFEAVLFKEEAYSGDYVSRAPDLVVPINHVLAPPQFEKWDFALTPPALNGAHSPLGIFISAGKAFRKGKHLEEVQIVDLTPTLLHIFGIPVPECMDGRVLKELFL